MIMMLRMTSQDRGRFGATVVTEVRVRNLHNTRRNTNEEEKKERLVGEEESNV